MRPLLSIYAFCGVPGVCNVASDFGTLQSFIFFSLLQVSGDDDEDEEQIGMGGKAGSDGESNDEDDKGADSE